MNIKKPSWSSAFSSIFSIGCVTLAVTLAALPFGLGRCIQHAGVLYSKVIREFVDVPKGEKIAMSIAIGYPDPDFKANSLVSPRVPLEKVATFVGFDHRPFVCLLGKTIALHILVVQRSR